MKLIRIKPRINKANGQINLSPKKCDLPKELRDNPEKIKALLFKLEGWERW